jgi:hypothetical protein
MKADLDSPRPPLDPPAEAAPQRSGRRRWALVAAMLIVVISTTVILITGPFTSARPSGTGVLDNSDPTGVATVTRQNLSSQTQVNATLEYAGAYSVVNQAQGTVTSLPSVGQVVKQGQVLYQVNGGPVVLLYGSTPAYRSLSEGASASDVTGSDVQQLNTDLVTLGYVTSSELSPTSDEFGYWTKVGIEDLQAALGVTKTGTLALGQVVFLPAAARITAVSATLGGQAPVGQPLMTATSTTRQVIIDLNAAQQSQVSAGDAVTITLPNNQTTPGVISSVGTVATAPASGSSNTSPTVTVEVTPKDPSATGTWDQAPVEVSITTASANDALVVPVNSLLAMAGGGYAVEVIGSNGAHHLVRVTLGIFDDADGLVAVTTSDLSAGQHLVVPST